MHFSRIPTHGLGRVVYNEVHVVKTRLISTSEMYLCKISSRRTFVTGKNQVVYLCRSTRQFHRSSSKYNNKQNDEKERVVILGTGWGGYSFLRSLNRKKYDVTIVSPRNYFLFTPLLCSTTVGTLEFRSIIEPIRNMGFKKSDEFYLATASELNASNKKVKCQSVVKPDLSYSLKYDRLVIAVGALNNTFGVPGVSEHAFFLKEIEHARKIRNKILSNFEIALQPSIAEEERQRLLHIVIVGGGPTGVEFGAELYDFVEQDVYRLYKQPPKAVRITLIESNKILASFDKKLQAYAEKKIRQREGFNLIKSNVIEVKQDGVILKDGTSIPCGLVVWSTGLAPQPFTKSLPCDKNKQGQILTDGYFRVIGEPSGCVYALGDCAEIEDLPLPCTAQVAERQGRYLAKLFNSCDDDKLEPFKFKSLGMLAYLGGYKALSDLKDVKLQGITSWILWRSAYLTRLGSWRLRLQVPMDWMKTFFFGRDTSRF